MIDVVVYPVPIAKTLKYHFHIRPSSASLTIGHFLVRVKNFLRLPRSKEWTSPPIGCLAPTDHANRHANSHDPFDCPPFLGISTMTPSELRQRFLDFFEQRDHEVVESAPVVPQNDPTLLFTNAGMNQFKDLLLGNEERDYQRATSTQKCIRAGGKHNDLDEVGKDGRHLTFFEMLGNWSFGDYYKEKAIVWAWEFILEVLELDRSRLYVTIFHDDDESFRIWRDIVGVEAERILRLGEEENFWSMGPTGPCGPCTEIHYDLKPEQGPFDFVEGYDEERINEIWNLVFMQYDRSEEGDLEPLPLQSVDTGLGLERVAMIQAGKDNIFQTELFLPIFRDVAARLGDEDDGVDDAVTIDGESIAIEDLLTVDSDYFPHLAVIGDHIRALMFALCDGAQFSNEGRGYVLRRILRRAVRFGRELGFSAPFLWEVGQVVIEHYGDAFPELQATGDQARELIKLEEERFFRNLDRGIELFHDVAGQAREEGRHELSGEEVFELHATYGFPPDLTALMAEEQGMTIDHDGYEERWDEHRATSQGKDVHADAAGVGDWTTLREGSADTFVGYDQHRISTHIQKIRHIEDDRYELLLEETPFYAESGGQVGDAGTIASDDGNLQFRVHDTQKSPIGIVHRAELVAGSADGDHVRHPVIAQIDDDRRHRTRCNHTATHLLHSALREEVSESIFQAGSLVAPDRLRFDFQHGQALSDDELQAIEERVNRHIRAQRPLRIHADIDRQVAVDKMGAMAIFGEKYGDTVRVVEIPGESVELCGGTHVDNTGEIAAFRIISEQSVGSGIRRVEAVTEEEAFQSFQRDRELLETLAEMTKSDVSNLQERLEAILDEKRELEKQVDSLSQKLADHGASSLLDDAEEISGITLIARVLDVNDRDQMLTYADKLRDQIGDSPAAVLLGANLDDKAALVCLLSDDVVADHGIKAGELINAVAAHVDGRGGGRPTLAQAGGSNPDGLPAAIDAFAPSLEDALS